MKYLFKTSFKIPKDVSNMKINYIQESITKKQNLLSSQKDGKLYLHKVNERDFYEIFLLFMNSRL